MNYLDNLSSEYLPEAATQLENDLILHWYPKRIVRRFQKCCRLLELGIGHGYASSIFNQACEEHVIVEGSKLVLEQFRKIHPGFSAEFFHEYFETFQPLLKFDVIVMGFVLEHVDDPGLLLMHYKKYLSQGGSLYIAVPNGKSLNRRYGMELGLINDFYSLNQNDIALGHKRQFCVETISQLIETCGYLIKHKEGIYLKPLPLQVLKTLPDFEDNLQAMLRVGIDFPELCVAFFLEVSSK